MEFVLDTRPPHRGLGHEVPRQSEPGRHRRQLLVVILHRRRVTIQDLRLILGLAVALYERRSHGSLCKVLLKTHTKQNTK